MIVGVITGPSACGKSYLAELLSQKFGLGLLSMDSTHAYRFFDVGLAKPKNKFLYSNLDTHHPFEAATVKDFVDQVNNTKKPTLIVGGSYFYLHVLLTGLNPVSPLTEQELKKLKSLSEDELIELKRKLPNLPIDPYRQERDLAFFLNRGFVPDPEKLNQDRKPVISNIPVVEIKQERLITQQRALHRIRDFFQKGLLQETRRNLALGFHDTKPMSAIGYKECAQFIRDKNFHLERNIQTNTNRLIRMQATWSNKLSPYLHRVNFDEVENYLVNIIRKSPYFS